MTLEQHVQLLMDEAAIRMVVDGISGAVDDKDWTLCRSYFLDDIEIDFSSLVGGGAVQMKADDLVFGGWSRNLYADKLSHHMHTGHQISVEGDHATCISRGFAWNKLGRQVGDPLWEVWGIYTHQLRRTANGWKCAGMIFKATHGRGNEKVREFTPE
jgi:ketosteroid isomerase-like protein